MPELPDVAVSQRYFDATALHQEIDRVDVRDTQILGNVSADELARELSGRSFDATGRHGKYLFATLDDARTLILHFGMTGHLLYFKQNGGEPDYTQMLCSFRNGYRLAYVLPRKLGEIRLVKDVEAFKRAKNLGPDVMADDFDFAAFKERLSGRRGMIKTRLTDQQIMAGIGNVYADEILFQARVHPQAAVEEFSAEILQTIFDEIKAVLETAIDCDADPTQFPESFIIPERQQDGTCPTCDGPVKRIEIGGRGTYFCPSCQEKPNP